MLLFGSGLGLLLMIALWIFCVIDVITTPDNEVRNLPKLAWVFIVLLFMAIGAIAWLLAGRPWTKVPANRTAGTTAGTAGSGTTFGRSAPRARASNPDDDEEFLATLRRRAEEQRRRAREQDGRPDAETN